MKLLFISNIIGKKIGSFAIASIHAAHALGFEYHMAANFNNCTKEQIQSDEEAHGITIHHIDFVRNPADPRNYKAYLQMIDLINREKIDAIHCNTPVGGVIGRLAGAKCGVKHVIYQAHGFHFYKGAPAINWSLYYPVEKTLAHYTDALITINKEDYDRARSFRLRNHGHVYYVPGVGIDLSIYEGNNKPREEKRKELGLRDTSIIVVSVGELIKRKNYETAIRAMAAAAGSDIHYLICGKGPLDKKLEELAEKLHVREQIHFLGFRSDIAEIMRASDIFLFPTFQEGLPRALSEAMACGLPCIVSKVRGNTDLIEDGVNGYLYAPTDAQGMSEGMKRLAWNQELRDEMGRNNMMKIREFSLEVAQEAICDIYRKELLG